MAKWFESVYDFQAGADVLISGSVFFESPVPEREIAMLKGTL